MGFFTRRTQPAANGNGTVPVTGEKHGRHHHEPYTMSRRPTFGQWLKGTWLDLLTMVVLGAVGLGVCFLTCPPLLRSLTLTLFRSTTPLPPRLARSPSPSQMARSSTHNSPTPSARKSSPSGWPPSSPPLSQSSSCSSCRSVSAHFGTSTTASLASSTA